MDKAILADYKSESNLFQSRRNRIACLIAFIFMPIGTLFDYLTSPNQFWLFLSIRLTVSGLMLALFVLQRSNKSGSLAPYISIMLVLVINASFCILMYSSGGVMTRYYTLISLMIIGGVFLLACTLVDTLIISIATLTFYALSSYLHYQHLDPQINWEQLVNNLYFIFLSGVLGAASSHFYTNARMNDFSLRRQLDIRNKELEQLDRMKSRFFANVSHDLRTPLTLILSPIQDLLQNSSRFDEKINGLVKIAHSNALRLLRLVNDLLDVIKLEEGKMNYHGEPVAIGKFLAAMVDSMRHLAESHQIALIKQLDSAVNIITADSYLLERIFINLIGNAIKFTPAGGTITVSEQYKENKVEITIADTGIGISKEDLPYIFDRFHQAGNSDTHRTQGTGLGLALVKEITEQMHGQIAVTSELGKGTNMRISFPVSEHATETADDLKLLGDYEIHPVSNKVARTNYRPSLNVTNSILPVGDGPLVLIVDDEPDMRSYLNSSMADHYRVIEAVDGEQALKLAKRHNPDLVLLDLMLPKLDGLAVCKILKDLSETKHIKIMLLTARIDEEAKIDALRNGADDFLTKPFSKVEVQTRLRNLLQTANLENTLRIHNKELEMALFTLKQTQTQLIHSEKINALGRLTAGLLHEINNPLNYSITALQFIKNEPAFKTDEILRDTFQDIDEGMSRIKTIISDLQIFAHPSETIKQEDFQFRDALNSALRFTEKEIETIRIIQDLQPDDEVHGSRGSIIQVMINMLTNASKAINAVPESRAGEIIITTKRQDGRINVYVRDNGIGIKKDTMVNIFDPFYTSRDVGEGMGLGLSICDTIIKNHGGAMKVRSEEGKWTEFCFDLPASDEVEKVGKHFELQAVK